MRFCRVSLSSFVLSFLQTGKNDRFIVCIGNQRHFDHLTPICRVQRSKYMYVVFIRRGERKTERERDKKKERERRERKRKIKRKEREIKRKSEKEIKRKKDRREREKRKIKR